MGATMLHAVVQRSSEEPNWALIAAIATAGVALVALILREVQQRRENLDQKVSNAVNAGLGRSLLEFRQMEESAKETLNAALSNAGRIERQLSELLEGSETHASRLTELLGAAADVVPQVADARVAIPALLVQQAQTARPDAATGYLVALRNSADASSDLLTRGGNIASRRLGASALALDLYERAVEINPGNADAAASAIRLRIASGQVSLEEGIGQITDVVRAHPSDRNAVSEALNVFALLARDYAGMLEFVEELLESGDNHAALLWRNRSIALAELRRPKSEVIESYQKSFDLAIESSRSELANTARPYAAFLRGVREYDAARSVVRTALNGDPRSADLLVLLGDLEADDGRFDSAQWCYELARECADSPSEADLVQVSVAELAVRRLLSERGILPGPHPPADTGVDDDGAGEAVPVPSSG